MIGRGRPPLLHRHFVQENRARTTSSEITSQLHAARYAKAHADTSPDDRVDEVHHLSKQKPRKRHETNTNVIAVGEGSGVPLRLVFETTRAHLWLCAAPKCDIEV